MEPTLLREAAALAESGVPCALAVVAAATGSVPGKPGATMLVTLDGTSRGTVGGAGLEERVKALCVEAIRRGEGGVHAFDLASWKPAGLDSVCGGTVTVAIHLVRPAPHLLLLGAGHCAEALARVADVLRWSVTLVDGRPGFADEGRFPHAQACVARDAAAFCREADLVPYSHAFVLGHSHHVDGDAVIALLKRGFAGHLGVIGSRSKLHAFRERAREAGLAEDAWSHVHSPIGLDVGAQTPAEIAVAVAAEIVAQLHKQIHEPPKAAHEKHVIS